MILPESKKKDIKTNKTITETRRLNSQGRAFQRLISVLTPVILLIVLELILRLTGYGINMDLFTEFESDSRYLTMNPDVSKKYFSTEDEATIGYGEIFRKEKSPETFRAFVLGASTAIGYPFTANGAFSRWLQYRLQNTLPDRQIEIVNLSLTAVNSYAALDFTKQLTEYEPDAILIYLGHNEYYGALGVGSSSRLGNNTGMVIFLTNLRELKIVQLIININRKTDNKENEAGGARNLMYLMAEDTDIPYGSEMYKKGIEQFRNNIEDICRILSRKNIPVVISTLVSNERSLKPFISDTTNTGQSAEYFYDLGVADYEKGDFTSAKSNFVKAKDLDMLRYRAPEEMNGIIAGLAEKYKGVYVADTRKMFTDRSEHGIPGNDMLMDHVHPYLYGQGLISESFYRELKENDLIPVAEASEMTFPQLILDMPVTVVDSLKGAFLTRLFLKEWPFNMKDLPVPDTSGSFEASLASRIVYDGSYWYQAMDELLQYYRQTGKLADALKVAEASTLVFPYEEDSYITCYDISIKMHDINKAEFHLQKAFQLNPMADKARELVALNLDMDDPERAMKYLEFLMEKDQANRTSYSAMGGNINMINTMKSNLVNSPGNIELINALAGIYLQLGYKDAAEKYLDLALNVDPKNARSLTLLKEVEALQGKYN